MPIKGKIFKNRLSLALENPAVVSNLVKEAAGHTERVLGEVLYVAKGQPMKNGEIYQWLKLCQAHTGYTPRRKCRLSNAPYCSPMKERQSQI